MVCVCALFIVAIEPYRTYKHSNLRKSFATCIWRAFIRPTAHINRIRTRTQTYGTPVIANVIRNTGSVVTEFQGNRKWAVNIVFFALKFILKKLQNRHKKCIKTNPLIEIRLEYWNEIYFKYKQIWYYCKILLMFLFEYYYIQHTYKRFIRQCNALFTKSSIIINDNNLLRHKSLTYDNWYLQIKW